MVNDSYCIADFKRTVDNLDVRRIRVLGLAVGLQLCDCAIQQFTGRLRIIRVVAFDIACLAGIKTLVSVDGPKEFVALRRNETVLVVFEVGKINIFLFCRFLSFRRCYRTAYTAKRRDKLRSFLVISLSS